MFSSTFVTSLLALGALTSVSGHGLLTAVTGANGVTAPGFGNDASVPRDTGSARTAEGDTPVFKKTAGPCGATKNAGNLDIATEMAKAMAATGGQVPSAAADGTISMVYHQVNGDGAGPLTMEVDTTGTGNSFVAMTPVQNAPGRRGRSTTRATDLQISGKLPAGTTCTGGPNGNACLVRVQNPVGPFGGCSVVTDSTTAAAAPPAASPAAASPAAATPDAADPPAASAPISAAAPAASAPTTATTAAGSITAASAKKVVRRLLQGRYVAGGPAWI